DYYCSSYASSGTWVF
nr:immunoglobulin light chain junction region [Macaca mulatta]MOX79097.1 immunoglobulin light chain junction region [Macaca mulatta]MOX80101.1 immunoglobulin light chain junction region [Macaca mulatta]MOX80434.1 immunoglobulin light chain junction region [Macaca mulatta]MOX80533.1 immunoglobulin light chain junction region [Macaca mulatta]